MLRMINKLVFEQNRRKIIVLCHQSDFISRKWIINQTTNQLFVLNDDDWKISEQNFEKQSHLLMTDYKLILIND